MGQVTDEFYADVLVAVHAPVSDITLHCSHAVQAQEGGTATNNPWNTTQPDEGSTAYNEAGVQNYPTEDIGVHATVVTLNNGRYNDIILALQEESIERFGAAWDASPWGTKGVAQWLADNPLPGGGGTPTPPAVPDSLTRLPLLKQGAGLTGSPNPHVATVQGLLYARGHIVVIDGRFGPATDSQVRHAQSDAGLVVDGIVGPHTYAALLLL